MSRPRKRALLTLAAAAGLASGLLLPGAAQGATAQKATDHLVELFCDDVEGGDGVLFFNVTASDVDGLNAGLIAFAPGTEPFVDPPTFVEDDEASASGSATAASVSVDVPVLEGSGDPAGKAHITATLVPLSIDHGTATLPDGSSFALEDGPCTADEIHVTFWGNNPTSAVRHFDSSSLDCDLLADGEPVGHLFLEVDPEGATAFVDAFFPDAGIDANTDAPISAGHVSSDLDYVDLETGDPAGSGSVDLTIAATGERFEYTLRNGTGRQRVHGEAFAVSGTLVAPGFHPFDLGADDPPVRPAPRSRPARRRRTTARPGRGRSRPGRGSPNRRRTPHSTWSSRSPA